MIPKLDFTSKSWPDEYKKKAEDLLNKSYYLNNNTNIKCWTNNTNTFPEAFIGCENKTFKLEEYGYADSEEAIEIYLKKYIEEPNQEYFIEIGLMSLDCEKWYKNGYYINEKGEDTGTDYWSIYQTDHLKEKRQYKNQWITFSIYEILNKE